MVSSIKCFGGMQVKFEKLSDNKIRIILSIQDLTEKHIDFHSFMANTIESQDILLDMLEEAKKETGFDAEDSNLKIEALAMADTNFVFTITKVCPELEKEKVRKKFTIKRKSINPITSTQAVYEFPSFDDFCSFLQFLKESNLASKVTSIADSASLYRYKSNYYLLLNQIHPEVIDRLKFYICITEFARYITNSKLFASKLSECGTLMIENHAFEVGLKHFAL